MTSKQASIVFLATLTARDNSPTFRKVSRLILGTFLSTDSEDNIYISYKLKRNVTAFSEFCKLGIITEYACEIISCMTDDCLRLLSYNQEYEIIDYINTLSNKYSVNLNFHLNNESFNLTDFLSETLHIGDITTLCGDNTFSKTSENDKNSQTFGNHTSEKEGVSNSEVATNMDRFRQMTAYEFAVIISKMNCNKDMQCAYCPLNACGSCEDVHAITNWLNSKYLGFDKKGGEKDD